MVLEFSGDPLNQDDRIIIRIDKDIEDLVPEYIEMTRRDVDTLRDALSRGDLDTMCRVGHTLKGSGGGYGFDGITEIGRNIEQLAKSGAQNEIDAWITRLSTYLDSVDVIPE